MMKRKLKVLQVTAVDVTLKYLLLPLIDRLIDEGYEVHLLSSDGPHARELSSRGYPIHCVSIARRIAPLSNLRSIWELYRLIKQEQFEIVHVHTPVAAVVGRIAARLARVPIVMYTAHGFYFHEHMHPWVRALIVSLERILGLFFSDWIFTQSQEDYETALNQRLVRQQRISWIGNGIDIHRFLKVSVHTELKQSLALRNEDRIVGFIGRLVQEKGIEELLLAMRTVVERIPRAKLLVIGDTLETDRDQTATVRIRQIISANKLDEVVRFVGHREDIPELLALMDLFVLPSHREGMPRSIIEAMAAGKPVVATNIRGCREEVVHGVTGFLVPLKDPVALAQSIIAILRDAELARRMGDLGRERAIDEFDESLALDRQINVYTKLVKAKIRHE